jgi:Zn-dependent protease
MEWIFLKAGFVFSLLPGLVIGIAIHEAAHAFVAKLLGDCYPKKHGRVTLNPFKHLSPLGTLAIFVLGFGWGRPVELNLYNFRRPKLYNFLTSIAGPASNLLLCVISFGLLYFTTAVPVRWFLRSLFIINALLAFINLIPIPPLDGSSIWPCIIPALKLSVSDRWRNIWFGLLLIFFYTGGLNRVVMPVLVFLSSLIPQANRVS